MKTELKKWPRNWIEHVNETCFFYFEDKGISFIDSKILCSDKTKKAKIYGMRLTFRKCKNIYDIFINHECSTFITNYYYKNYYRIEVDMGITKNFVFMAKGTLQNGSDHIGPFIYSDLGGEASEDNVASAYNIIQSIEDTINCHTNRGNDDDDEGGENDPVEPFSPSDVMEPELLSR